MRINRLSSLQISFLCPFDEAEFGFNETDICDTERRNLSVHEN